MLFKFSIDAGGGSNQGFINLVNVINPQGQEHTKTIYEFGGVKDTHENMRRAVFESESKVRRDMEAIYNRHCVVLKMSIGSEFQCMIASLRFLFHHLMGSPKQHRLLRQHGLA